MSNPIKASDLYQDDGAINEAIKQMEALRRVYTDNLDAITKEAEKLFESLNKVNTSTSEGQNATRKAATDAEKLKKAQKEYAGALNDTNTKIRALKQAKSEDIRLQKLQTKVNNSAEGSYNRLSGQYAILKLRLNAMSKAERSATKSGQALEQQARDMYEEMNRLQKVTGKHQLQVGNYGIATENLHPILGRLNMQLGAMGTSIGEITKSKTPFKTLTTGILNFGKATLAFMLSPIGLAITALGALFLLIRNNTDTVVDFNSDLIDVGKTANLSGEELRDLGQDIVGLSKKLKTVGTPALLQYAKVAGQLGVKGKKDILIFTEALAKLETASDISGDEGATNIARFLNLTDGGVQNVGDFGDEIVGLGNNFAATENEILNNATAIAQNTGQYKIGRQFALSYATATKAVGLESQVTGSSIGRTLGVIEKAIRTGQGIDTIARLTGNNIDDLKSKFKNSKEQVFNEFIAGLNEIDKKGESLNGTLESLGIVSSQDTKVMGTLATAGFDVLSGSIDKVANSSGALDEEFGAASKKLKNQWARIGIAWDNLVLRIEDGNGVIGTVAAFLAGQFADSIDRASTFIQVMGGVISGVINVFRQYFKNVGEFVDSIKSIGDIEIDFGDPLGSLKNIKKAFVNVKDEYVGFGEGLGDAFKEGFTKEMSRADEAMKDALTGTEEEFEKVVASSVKSVKDLDQEISNLKAKLKDATNRTQAKGIQDDIKALEKKRNAILGVANANLKEAETRGLKKEKAVLDVMEDGQDKDIAILEMELAEKKKLWEKYGLDVTLLDDYEKRQRFLISQKYLKKEQELIDKNKKEKEDKLNKDFSEGKKPIDEGFDLRMSEIDLLNETEAEKTKLRLEAERDRLQKIINLNKDLGGKLSDVQIQQMQNVIDRINGEIASVGSGEQKDIYDIVGLKLSDEKKEAISMATSFAIDNIKAMMAAKVEAADMALQKAQEETQQSQSKLDQEIEARNNGYANNVLTAQRELELNKKKEQEALKTKQKAQRQQEAVDTAMQISSLITATAGLWKSNAGVPIIGAALAAAATVAMWASFAASKIKAKSAAKEKFGDGGLEFLDGGSHASGNDIPIGMTSGGKQRTAEGGEAMAIIKKSSTRKYRGILPDIIKSLNQGTFEQTYSNAFIPSNEMPDIAFNSGFDSPDLKNIEDDLGAIRKQGDRERYTDSQGRLVEKYKNVTVTYV